RGQSAPPPAALAGPPARPAFLRAVLARHPRARVAPTHRGIADLAEPRVARPSDELIQREDDSSRTGVVAVEARAQLVLEDAVAHSNEPGLVDRRSRRVGGEAAVPRPDRGLRVASARRGRRRG